MNVTERSTTYVGGMNLCKIYSNFRSTSVQMKPFIYGNRFNTAIIDLDETALLLRQALNFLAHVAYNEGIILFSVRQPQLVHLVERAAIGKADFYFKITSQDGDN